MSPTITYLDHTADVGVEVAADSLEQLFRSAADGMLRLLAGAEEDEPITSPRATTAAAAAVVEDLDLTAPDRPRLLAAWLRELLFLHDARVQAYEWAEFERLDPTRLVARVWLGPASRAVREIKGVTYHDLVVERAGGGWRARVIFDV